MKKKNVDILGSTGSIGKSSIEVLNKLKNYKVFLIFANNNFKELNFQIKKFNPKIVISNNFDVYLKLKNKFKNKKILVTNNYKEIKKFVKKIDVTISAIPGFEGLEPTLFFTKLSKKILIANKESVICGWHLINRAAKKSKTEIIPIDSEHFSIHYLLKNYKPNQINKIYITASGGPFLKLKKKFFKTIKVSDALRHPKWKMGKKISVDSSTLMNKVLEVIEAAKIFSFKLDQFEILIHPQSLIHAIVELNNGIKIFLYHIPDMKIPISNALEENKDFLNIFNFQSNLAEKNLEFFNVDKKRFPVVNLLSKVNINNSSAILLNRANEILVDKFIKKKISFLDISYYLKLFLTNSEYIKTSKQIANSINKIEKVNNLGTKIIYNTLGKKC